MKIRLCEWCDGPIPQGAAYNAKWCSAGCRKAAHNARRRAALAERRANEPARKCGWCGTPIPLSAPRQAKWCSVECRVHASNARQRAQRAEWRATEAAQRVCGWCAAPLPAATWLNVRYCSPACKQLATEDMRTTRGRRRRAAKRNSASVPYSSAELHGRRALFGGACWVCGATAPLDLDHIIPLQPRKGTADPVGADRLDNFAELCHACNDSKGNRPLPSWLPGRLAKLNGTTRKAEHARLDALVARATGRPAAEVWRAFYTEPVDYATVNAVIRALMDAELTEGPAPQAEAALHTGDGECAHCGGPIPPTRLGTARYCSKACRKAAAAARKREQRAAAVVEQRTDRKCDWCGGPIPPDVHGNATLCSAKCRMAARNARARARRRQQAHALAA